MSAPSRTMPRDYRPAAELARAAGWTVEPTKDHWQWKSPDGHTLLVTPSTSTSRAGLSNHLAALRKAGLDVPRAAGKGGTRKEKHQGQHRPAELTVDNLGGWGYVHMQGTVIEFRLGQVSAAPGHHATWAQLDRVRKHLAAAGLLDGTETRGERAS